MILAALDVLLRNSQNRNRHPAIHRTGRDIERFAQQFGMVLPPVKRYAESEFMVWRLEERLPYPAAETAGLALDVQFVERIANDSCILTAAANTQSRIETCDGH